MRISQLKDFRFGATAENIDCASLSESAIGQIRAAIYLHQLLVIPDQHHLSPSQEVQFYQRINPDAASIWRDQKNNPWERYKVEQGNTAGTYQIPEEPGVLVLGKGEIDHHGLRVTLGGERGAYGQEEGSQVLGGGDLQWHVDGTFYEQEPPLFTQMRCIEAPSGEGHRVEYDDGSGAHLWCEAGSTAFASGRIAFDLLDAEKRELALDTRVHCLSQPFQSTYHLGNSWNGLRVIDVESEKKYRDGLEPPGSPISDPKARIYPLIWTCPDTHKKALMPHPRCMSHLELLSRKQHLGKIASRLLVEELMRPAIEPELVYVHPWRAGDLVIWNNRCLWHSATGQLSAQDRRVQHLTAYNSSSPPI
jgi:alpha-ketoglutarate-dependent taurine dioxygenase